LVENYGYNKIISYTTRQPRKGEANGIDYHFISVEQFKSLKEQGFFAETAVYNNWHYGTAKEDCTNDKVAVLTPHGLRQISKLKDIDVTSFYINVARRDRLIKILQRGDDIDEACRRSLSDVGQFDGIEDEVDFVINNDGYKKSIEKMASEVRIKAVF
jgi:guanylate kinase